MILQLPNLSIEGDLVNIVPMAIASLPNDLETVRDWAIGQVKRLATEEEQVVDNLISGNFVRAIMLNTEIVQYYQNGRPTNPSVNVYIISAAMATRRNISLHNMLEILFDRWRIVQSRIADITTELDRLLDELITVSSIDEIKQVLLSISF